MLNLEKSYLRYGKFKSLNYIIFLPFFHHRPRLELYLPKVGLPQYMTDMYIHYTCGIQGCSDGPIIFFQLPDCFRDCHIIFLSAFFLFFLSLKSPVRKFFIPHRCLTFQKNPSIFHSKKSQFLIETSICKTYILYL